MIDLKTSPPPPPPRVVISPAMSRQEMFEALKQLDLWSRHARTYMATLRDAIIELQDS